MLNFPTATKQCEVCEYITLVVARLVIYFIENFMILVYTQQEGEDSKGGGDAEPVGHTQQPSLQLKQDAISVTFFNLRNS